MFASLAAYNCWHPHSNRVVRQRFGYDRPRPHNASVPDANAIQYLYPGSDPHVFPYMDAPISGLLLFDRNIPALKAMITGYKQTMSGNQCVPADRQAAVSI